ncbi:CidA/LrgA family protein [Staphylococcus canis]|uniref:CidA/LrgA family protein n=1 Tax=Staphylococcus canis TaxID=2724942 RepID=A0ABS0T6V2_9STAP|nr:CidA/LrgA family protein [Staphylococcus canis]MBI5974476.1 CidA/LrgA family protein [Staphylococcus canis]
MTVSKIARTFIQIVLIYMITFASNWIQQYFHLPIAGSIIGLFIFFLLLQFKIIKVEWIKEGANFLLTMMVFFFVPSVVGVMDVVTEMDLNFILFFLLLVIGTILVALCSGLVAEKMTMGRLFHQPRGDQ